MRVTVTKHTISPPMHRNDGLRTMILPHADWGRQALAEFPFATTRAESTAEAVGDAAPTASWSKLRTAFVTVREAIEVCAPCWQAITQTVERPWFRPVFDDRLLVEALNAGALSAQARRVRLPLRVSVGNGVSGTGFVFGTAVRLGYFPYPLPATPPEEAACALRAIPVATG